MPKPKKLIEVAMPIKEISAESVRDKSIRHGHISTLHLWWARRPLPVCRAVVFGSLVPDPEDAHCPQAFRDAVKIILGKQNNPGDPYAPYDNIPWTTASDPMEDNLRNRLQLFIGKFTPKMQEHLLNHTHKPPAKDQLTEQSLIKWDSKNDEEIINRARRLIWVAYNTQAEPHKTAEEHLSDFNRHYKAIKVAQNELYAISDRHLNTPQVQQAEKCLQDAIERFQNRMPSVFDPFAGGGAIPLEAARLGCRSYGNDINPVAHIIQKGSLEFPQKYGKPIAYTQIEFVKLYGKAAWEELPSEQLIIENGKATAVQIPNRLSFDVEFYAKKLLEETEKEIGHYYPADKEGNKPIAYYWARVGTCSNPSCEAQVPLLKGFYMVNKSNKKVYLNPIIRGTQIDFEIKEGKCEIEGWNYRGNLKCPCCGNTTDVNRIKEQSINEGLKERLLAVIIDGKTGKEYRLPFNEETEITDKTPEVERPTESMQRNSAGGDTFSWGVNKWGQLFSNRQLLALQTLVQNLNKLKEGFPNENNEYTKSVVAYLGIWIDKISSATTAFGRWNVGGEKIETPFARQAIPMMFDYPEGYLFSGVTGSAQNQLDWIIRYIESESHIPFSSTLHNASSGEVNQFPKNFLTATVTDPPYYDAIAYADLSDFFYVWLKRTLGDIYPQNFSTPQTPKTEECTALKHHHNNQYDQAKKHFEGKLLQIFQAIEYQTQDMVSIMFAHQSTEAWTTLINSVLGANMNITGSWAIDTEMANRSIGLAGAALASSVTVACRPTERNGVGSYNQVKKDILETVEKEVTKLYALGFRGADLLTACFGMSVSVFGGYEYVEKADGTRIEVAELLDMAREAAFNALLKGFDGDDFTKFYIGWLQLYGFSETDFDDAAKFSRVGLTIDVNELFQHQLFIKNKNQQTLASYQERIKSLPNLGTKHTDTLIDKAHRAMALYAEASRGQLLSHIGQMASGADNTVWRVLASLSEVLPQSSNDFKQVKGLLINKESLLRDAKTSEVQPAVQTKLSLD